MGEIKIDRAEVLRYLGYRGGEIDDKVRFQLELAEEKVLSALKLRTIYAVFDLDKSDGIKVLGTVLSLEGEDVARHLRDCDKVILLAATAGERIETEIRIAQVRDMALASIIDATADVAIEAVCDELQDKLTAEFAPLYLTERFSPGYGDMPITQQKLFCAVIDTDRKIGLRVSDNFLLSPVKSVTALIGISEKPIKSSGRGCANCNMVKTCEYRKAGITCAK